MSNTRHDRRIDYIEFSVKSVPDAKRFYGSAFGWSFEDYGSSSMPPISKPWSVESGRRFHFTDPSGNELSVWSDQEKRER